MIEFLLECGSADYLHRALEPDTAELGIRPPVYCDHSIRFGFDAPRNWRGIIF